MYPQYAYTITSITWSASCTHIVHTICSRMLEVESQCQLSCCIVPLVPCRVHSTSTIWHREDIERSHSIKRAVACFPDKSLEYILPLSSRKKNMVRTLSSDLAEEYSNPYYNSMSRMESHEPCTAWLSKDPASERTVLNWNKFNYRECIAPKYPTSERT